jgi:hypothetical protein
MIKAIDKKLMMEAESILYNTFKNRLDIVKSPRFYKWFHDTYGKELHHLFGSHGTVKCTDLLAMPVDRITHQQAENNKSEFGVEHLVQSVNILQKYTQHLESLLA